MKKLSLKMIALMATMMMSLTTQAKTQDVGGRVEDIKPEFIVKLKLKSGKCLTRPLGQPLSLQSFSKTSRDYE